MISDTLFRSLSYAVVACGVISLCVSGGIGVTGAAIFGVMMAVAWKLENTRFQLSEFLGTAFVILAIPVFFLLWRYRVFDTSTAGSALPGILARMILALSAIKLLQKKADRDWVFLYVMSFFEVLLAAGITISALYLGSFILFVLAMVSTIILFEMRRTESTITASIPSEERGEKLAKPLSISRRLPVVSVLLIAGMIAVAMPMFFLLPRVAGAGIGGNQSRLSTTTGFSDTVRLGGIGEIQQSDEVVMRVRIDRSGMGNSPLLWRGIALDRFDNQSWRRSRVNFRDVYERGQRDLIQLGYARDQAGLRIQTFYLEPMETPVLFALPKAVGIQGNFPVLFKDSYDSVSFPRVGERISYKVLSDVSLPEPDVLRADGTAYPYEYRDYLQYPRDQDERIYDLAQKVIGDADNRYDAAVATERFLRTEFGYTLAQKAGGDQPLADFLFNVREGHCEYFATAMAIMLRTQGIATRVVNGFQTGEYNETADVYVVRQREAHSWVEVYFPDEDVWVPFDPTPPAGPGSEGAAGGLTERVGKYLEALEMFWIQYFVAFDSQEQRSLFTSVRRGVSQYNNSLATAANDVVDSISAWWAEVRGDHGMASSLTAIGFGALVMAATIIPTIFLIWLFRRVRSLSLWQRLRKRFLGERESVVEFYSRLLAILDLKGIRREPHQSPMEFAYAVGMPEVIKITESYNKVRFGGRELSRNESEEIKSWLDEMDKNRKASDQ
ncbi:MAG: DUF3488 domain-containing protein [Acidobacteria bacterium]|nr:DUF3488 domain-containing protein [Acidobacteriota bacterium]